MSLSWLGLERRLYASPEFSANFTVAFGSQTVSLATKHHVEAEVDGCMGRLGF